MDTHLSKSGPTTATQAGPSNRIPGVIALAALLFFGWAVFNAAEAEEAASTPAEEEDTGSSADAESMVATMIEEWFQEGAGRGLRAREELNVVQGTSLVALRTDDQRWGKARSLAFQNAFIQAMGAYVASVRQRTTVSVMRDYFSEDVPESQLRYQEGEPPDSFVERIVLKSAVLTEQTLDQKLSESGMTEDEIKRLTTPVQKRTVLAESISRRTLNEAIGSAAGLVPVKTFEGVDDEGNSAIGIVAVYSERMRHIANQISKGAVIRPDPDRVRDSIADQVASYAAHDLPNEFGVRVMWDDQGFPAIVSFGQWGWSPENLSKKRRAQRRKFALKQAANDALSNLTVFIKASTRFTEESNVGADLEQAFNLPRGGVPEEIDDAVILDKLVETARVEAEVALTGFTQERTWTARHPLLDGTELVGVISYWSPAREDAIRRTIGQEAKHAPPKEVAKEPPKKPVTGTAQSRDPDLADF